MHLGPAAHLALIQIKPAPPLGGSVHPMRRDWLFAISLVWLVLLVIAFLFLLTMF